MEGIQNIVVLVMCYLPIPVAARSKVWVCGSPFAGIMGSNPSTAWMFSLMSVVSCQVEVSATG